MVRRYTRRRIGTVGGVEIHRGTTIDELGLWKGTYVSEADLRELEQDPHTVTLVIRELEPSGEEIVAWDSSGLVHRTTVESSYRVDALLIATMEAEQAQIILAESLQSGKGTKIVRAFEKYAKSHGIKTVYLVSDRHAKGFWEKMGFEFVENSDEAFKELTRAALRPSK